MKAVLCMLAVAATMAGCSRIPLIGGTLQGLNPRGQAAEVEGVRFRSRLATTTEDDRGFVVRTRGAGRNLGAALEAARVTAFEHCLARFGGTEVIWTLSPDRGPEAAAPDADGAVSVAGTCVQR